VTDMLVHTVRPVGVPWAGEAEDAGPWSWAVARASVTARVGIA